MEQCCIPIDLAVTTDFHVQVIKKDHNYFPPYSQETIQLLQDSAEMGMKYRERCYNLKKRKINLKNCGRSPGYTYNFVSKIFHPREYHGATNGLCFSNSRRDFSENWEKT